jgi:hypothetical protein
MESLIYSSRDTLKSTIKVITHTLKELSCFGEGNVQKHVLLLILASEIKFASSGFVCGGMWVCFISFNSRLERLKR